MEQRLRTILYGNSAFSIISATLFIALSKPLAIGMNVPNPDALIYLGFAVLVFAFFVGYTASQKLLKKELVKTVITLDFSWVVGSVIVIALNPFNLNTNGLLAVTVVGIFVLLFGLFQTITIKKI